MRYIILFAALSVVSTSCQSTSNRARIDAELGASNDIRFDQLKSLAGTWKGSMSHQGGATGPMEVRYKVTAGGHSVVETIGPGTEMEMVSVYSRDGDELVMTHYCVAGNQPRLRARKGAEDGVIHWDFVACENLADPKAMHMHDAKFTFVDANTLRTEWVGHDGGKANPASVMELKRVAEGS